MAAVNVIWLMIANKRLDFTDPKAQDFIRNLSLMFRQGSPTGGGSLENFIPIFRHFSSSFKFSQQITHNIQQYIRVSHLTFITLNSTHPKIKRILLNNSYQENNA